MSTECMKLLQHAVQGKMTLRKIAIGRIAEVTRVGSTRDLQVKFYFSHRSCLATIVHQGKCVDKSAPFTVWCNTFSLEPEVEEFRKTGINLPLQK